MKLYDAKLRDGVRVVISSKHLKDNSSHGVHKCYSPTSIVQSQKHAIEDIKRVLVDEHSKCEVLDELPEISPLNNISDISILNA